MNVCKCLVVVGILSGCGSGSSSSPQAIWKKLSSRQTAAPDTSVKSRVRGIDEAFMEPAVSLSSGAAYVSEMENGVWYIRGEHARRVKVIGSAQDSASFQNAVDIDIEPTLDGRAYATSNINKAIWFLIGAEAHRIREGLLPDTTASNSATPNSANFWFASYTSASRRAHACLEEQQAGEEQPSEDNSEP